MSSSNCCNCNSASGSLNIENTNFITRESGSLISEAFNSVLMWKNIQSSSYGDLNLLCSTCLPLLFEFCRSKKLFFQSTGPTSLLSAFKPGERGVSQSDIKEEFVNEVIIVNHDQVEVKPVASPSEEIIIPDVKQRNEDSRMIVSSSPYNNKVNITNSAFEYKEQYIKIEIEKLSQEMIKELLKLSTNTLLLKTDSLQDGLFNECEKCTRIFSNLQELKDHQTVHADVQRNLKCSFCPQTFSNLWFLKNHLSNSHDGIEILHFCKVCTNTFYSEVDLQEHVLKKHDIRPHPFKCKNCLESFKVIEALRAHLIAVHQGTREADAAEGNVNALAECELKTKTCLICNLVFGHRESLRTHMVSYHGYRGATICEVCGLDFETYKELTRHRAQHTSCPVCCKEFLGYSKMNIHYNRVHVPVFELPFACEICGQRYSNNSRLRVHYLWHVEMNGLKHYCNLCNKSFQLKSHLKLHTKKAHSENNKETYKCQFCDDVFALRANLNIHLSQNHEEYLKFSCHICGKRFLNIESVSSHKRIHTQETAFKDKKDKVLKMGKIVVSGKVEVMSCYSSETFLFTCPFCVKSCDSQSHFFRHLKTIHSIEGYADPNSKVSSTINCPICDKSFQRKDLMDKHRRRSHNITNKAPSVALIPRSFDCPHCKKTITGCASYPIFMSHVKRHEIFVVEDVNAKPTVTKVLSQFYNEDDKKFLCFCERIFLKQSVFERHLASKAHPNTKVIYDYEKKNEMQLPFKCDKCPGVAYPTITLLRRHKENHKFRKDRKCRCTICDELLRSQKYLKIHMKQHSKQAKTKQKLSIGKIVAL